MGEDATASAWLESGGVRTPVRGSCLLGRAATCEVVLADAKASRQHALVHNQEPGGFWLIDLGSANGTYLNGRRVAQPCRLSDGDTISLAGFTFVFRSARTDSARRFQSAPGEATTYEVRTPTCWLLVADIQGATQLVQKLPGDEAPRMTGRWLSACTRIIEQRQGMINKFLGDGFLAYWMAGPATAASVAATALALKDLQHTDGPPFRFVLHYGKVTAGGVASLGEESLAGNEVNFVFRLEKLAASMGTLRLMSEPARTQLGPLLAAAEEGKHALQGFPGEFPVFSF
jgi:adenylate cyclase